MRTTPESTRVRVLCVDDSDDMAAMLSKLIDAQRDFESVGTLDCADELVAVVEQSRASVIVIDLTMPGLSPLTAIRSLKERCPWVSVIAFSGYDDPATVAAATEAGASAVVSKHRDPEEILRVIRRVAAT